MRRVTTTLLILLTGLVTITASNVGTAHACATSAGARPLPVVATLGRPIGAAATTIPSSTTPAFASTPDTSQASATTTDPAPTPAGRSDGWPTPALVTLAVAIGAFIAVALLWLRHTFARGPHADSSASQ